MVVCSQLPARKQYFLQKSEALFFCFKKSITFAIPFERSDYKASL